MSAIRNSVRLVGRRTIPSPEKFRMRQSVIVNDPPEFEFDSAHGFPRSVKRQAGQGL